MIKKLCFYVGKLNVKKKQYSLLFLMLFFSQLSIAQSQFEGTVIDEGGVPIPGVSVKEKNTGNGTVTDFDGAFSISTNSDDAILIFSFVGYKTKELNTSGLSGNLSVTLEEDLQALEEVVLIGYGKQDRSQVTSAVASVSEKDFNPGKIQDAAELVKGKVAGLVVTNSSGNPNDESNIMLRGVTTLNGSTKPLILIDGVPGDLTMVAPENISSVDVLKDASAAAIYGTRGANGVILISTKSGSFDRKTSVVYDAFVSVSDFYKEADFMTPQDIRDGLTSFSDGGFETDWLDAISQTGFMHNHALTINGGSELTSYSGNISYRKEDGTIKKSNNDQLRLQLNLEQYLLKDILKVGFKIFSEQRKRTPNNIEDNGISNIYRQAVIRNPTSPIYGEDGDYFEEFGRYQYFNPVAMNNELIGERELRRTNITGNITFEPIKNWVTNLLIAKNLSATDISTYTTSRYYSSKTTGFSGSAYKSYEKKEDKFLELTTNYEFDINTVHRFNALAGYSYNYFSNSNFYASNSDFPTDGYLYNNIGVGARLNEGNAGMGSGKYDSRLIGFFGRIQYGYENRFNLLASIRREGSSQFGDNHKWGLFPSVSAGWTLSNEAFLKSASWINNLKLRAGYGVTGQRPNANYLSLTTYNYDSNYGNFVNEDGQWVAGLMVTQNPNPDLKWERTSEVNIGLDFSFFNSRLGGSLDVYRKDTDDLLYSYNVPLPPNIYGQTLANVGSIRNQGFELMINALPVSNDDFSWETTVTLTHNDNELLSLSNDLYETEDYLDVAYAGDPINVPTHRVEVGQAIGNFWGLKSVGVTENGLFLVEDPNTGEAIPYSTSLNTNDYRQYLGNGFPTVYMGWTNTLRYKNFDLTALISGQFGFDILNTQRMFYENNSIQYNRLKSAADPVYGERPLSGAQAQAFVSHYLEKGDFVKLDNITLGYNFKIEKISNYISDVRVYCSAKNFLTITNYSGMDPELANRDFYAAGNDFRDKYPTIKSFTIGTRLNF
ncbi:SusC/RagA family TonB-linked outer membrane protein [Zunongwangia profunda]|jgi:TonB-linked SusC/RagA family outer membrane protein|uniref:SusC/RagA family TonB-linked outer membrane protein n=1 Tax=Zunongwangia profunda TaxID=398743 RepID=UPI001D18EC02|nr:SusC/RagA family TonB-linked outer membrane protein [Zunongwangia profunda]MCC4229598.1 SusC/RagA family TonB-linked outer membrane protein [Zunongwangia profunda]